MQDENGSTGILAAVAAGFATLGYSAVLNRLLPEQAHVPANLSAGAAFVVAASQVGVTPARLGVSPKHVFICGSNPFVNAAADGGVAAGTPLGTIRTERYGA